MQDLAFARSAPAIDDGEPDAARHGPPLQSLGSADSAGLLDMLDRLELLGSEQQFRDLLDGPMQGLLPHRGLVCATEAWPFAPAADPPRCRLLNGLPGEGLASLQLAGGTQRPVLTERWLHTRKPVLVELLHDTRSWPQRWVQHARQLGFCNVALHAFFDAGAGTFTSFCFTDLPGRLAPRHAHILRLLVPHLHLALARIAGMGAPVQPKPAQALHPHQLDILRWLQVGKTNWEISMILGMSVHNVKYHVAQLLAKLGAANRVHAVARARDRGLLDERAPGPGSPPQRPR